MRKKPVDFYPLPPENGRKVSMTLIEGFGVIKIRDKKRAINMTCKHGMKGEKDMVKHRKLALILAVLMLSTAFMTGCGSDTGGENGSEGGTEITDPSGSAGEEESDQEEATSNHQDEATDEKTTITARGTLKSIDDGKITIDTQSDGELVLEINEKSKILADGALVDYDQLEGKIGSEIVAEYYGSTKVVAAANIQN